MEILLYVGGFCFTLCYIPQIVRLLKRKSSDDVSITLFSISAIAYTTNLIYFIMNWKTAMIFNYLPGLILTLVSISLILKYRGR